MLGEVAAGAQSTSTPQRRRPTADLDWRSRSGTERKAILHAVADLIVERRHEIAVAGCVDTGQTMRFMSAAALRGADNFRFFADRASAADGLSLPTADHINYTTRHPIGPSRRDHTVEYAVHVEHLEDRPALAAGCTVVTSPPNGRRTPHNSCRRSPKPGCRRVC